MDNDDVAVFLVGAFVAFVAGYVLGREHARWEIKTFLKKKLPSPPF